MSAMLRVRIVVAALAAVVGLFVTTQSVAEAQTTLDTYRTAETIYDGFAISRPDDRGHLKFGVHLTVDYGNDPLVFESVVGNADTVTTKLVEHEMVGSLALSLGIADHLVLFGGIPMAMWMDGESLGAGAANTADGAGVGDPWVGARLRLAGENDDAAAIALQAGVTFPLAKAADKNQLYRGNDGLTFEPKLVFELRPGPFRFTFNAGVNLRNDNSGGNQLKLGGAVTLALVKKRLDALVEMYGASPLGKLSNGAKFGDREYSPLEVIGGLKYYSPSGFSFGVAGGPGLLHGIGSPDLRLIAQLGYAAPKDDGAPVEERVVANDRDADGINDNEDACPDQAEDMDTFEDTDGCPDLDNDQDGVPDANDGAPMVAEDRDGFQDDDGIPEPDNDADGIMDADDQCPLEAEDRDGFEDENGCPDLDNDQDGVPDAEDKCPTAPGQPSTKPEDNGCPKTVRVDAASGQINILERVEFASGKDVILKRSNPILIEIRATVAANPQIKRIRVEGHTDDKGVDAKNMDLSKRRAHSVAKWLTDNGIDLSRVEAYGCGENVPLDSNATDAGRQANRRVEFHIIDPSPPNGVRSTDGCQLAQ